MIRGASNNLADRPDSTGVSAKLDNPTRDTLVRHDTIRESADSIRTATSVVFFRTCAAQAPSIGTFGHKEHPYYGTINLQFRAEAFNFLNHVNLGIPKLAPASSAGPGRTEKIVAAHSVQSQLREMPETSNSR